MRTETLLLVAIVQSSSPEKIRRDIFRGPKISARSKMPTCKGTNMADTENKALILGVLGYSNTVFCRPHQYFSVTLTVILTLSGCYKIFTSD